MENELFSLMELDALGEMMNISLGSSATAVSNMLEHRVDITTPKVTVVDVADFELGNLEPAMGVKISYVEGLDGSNIMLLRRSDVKVIVDILMGYESPEKEFELNELTISAVCEVMNQMMGSAATALSDFLGFPVNISTPESFELDDLETFKKSHFPEGAETVVVVRFSLKIEGAMESEFMNVMSVELAKELLHGLGIVSEDDLKTAAVAEEIPAPTPVPAPAESAPAGGEKKMSQEEIERMMSGLSGGDAAPAPAPAPAESAPAGGEKKMSQEEIERMMSGLSGGDAAPAPAAAQPQPTPPAQPAAPMQPPMPPYGYPPMEGNPYAYMGYPPMYYPGYGYPPQATGQIEPKVIATQEVQMPEMQAGPALGKEQSENLDLIMDVPLQVTVEIGRTRRKVQEILEFSKGSLVVLDKLAGDHVDLFVNGKCVAKGDVVVIDDNFGVRITEIVQKGGLEEIAYHKK